MGSRKDRLREAPLNGLSATCVHACVCSNNNEIKGQEIKKECKDVGIVGGCIKRGE